MSFHTILKSILVNTNSKTSSIACSSLHRGNKYSLHFKIKVTFGHKLGYEMKGMFGEISLKLRQTYWDVAINNLNVVIWELPSQITIYTCLRIYIWTQRRPYKLT
jgi:hypothetical protein